MQVKYYLVQWEDSTVGNSEFMMRPQVEELAAANSRWAEVLQLFASQALPPDYYSLVVSPATCHLSSLCWRAAQLTHSTINSPCRLRMS